MENIKFDEWVKNRMDFSNDDKQQCIGLTSGIMDVVVEARRNSILSIPAKINQYKEGSDYKGGWYTDGYVLRDVFLQRALSLAIAATAPDEMRKILQDEIMEKDSKGAELLKQLLIMEGVIGIGNGDITVQIAVKLASYFGEDFFV